jgi:hypothetical protein
VKVVIFNPNIIPEINNKQQQVITIVNTVYSPIVYSPENGLPNTGTIILKFDGNRTYEGEGILMFPFTGTNYPYTFFTLNSVDDAQLIYGENKTSPTSSGTPPISIDEGYAARASFEQANQNNGISFVALGIAGIALVAYFQFENGKDKLNDSDEMRIQLKKLNDAIERLRKEFLSKRTK